MTQNSLKEIYEQKIANELKKEFKLTNQLAVPKIVKVVVNMGVTDPIDSKQRKLVIDDFVEQITTITGQKPMITTAKRAISSFKLRQGDPLGIMVTLRNKMMWEFLEKVISITLPRVKDFRGIPKKAFDGHGNYSLGIEEQIVFPEINFDKVKILKGLQINIVTNTNDNKKAFRLLELLGFPFEKDDQKE